MRGTLIWAAVGFGLFTGAAIADRGDEFLGFGDFGLYRDNLLHRHSEKLFGVTEPLKDSSRRSITLGEAEANPIALVTLAGGLQARVISATSSLGANVDMMALWPDDHNPTHIIACNEQEADKPGVQRVRLTDGLVETILTGTISCDPVRRTPWGAIIVGEETSDGNLIEIIRPLETTNVSFNRTTGVASGGIGAANVAARPQVGRLAFEGIALYPNGIMYYGDENRPSSGTGGGAYFKFVPNVPWPVGSASLNVAISPFAPADIVSNTPSAPAISNLSESPFASGGKVYGLRLGRRSGNTDYGQGSNTGQGVWVEINPADIGNLRAAAAALKLTGYYRPEDIDIDGKALAKGDVRFCGSNTGNESDNRNWGEVMCFTDGTLDQALANGAIPEAQYLVVGFPDFAMMDNIAYQPSRGNWIVHEDGDGPEVGRNNDLWSCLDDGSDDDRLSDGCVKIATLNDLNAEWTGGIFDASGRRFFVSVQHNVTGHGVILEITGWQPKGVGK